jgi:hypothetical protein
LTHKKTVIFYRISRWIDEEEDRIKSTEETSLKYIIMDMSGEYYFKNMINVSGLYYIPDIINKPKKVNFAYILLQKEKYGN